LRLTNVYFCLSSDISVILASLERSESREELIYASCGVLMNIIVDTEAQKEFNRKQGLDM